MVARVTPYFDQEFGEELDRVFKEKFDLLLGRKTYEIFAGYWLYYDEYASHGGIAKLFNDNKVRGFALRRGRYELGGLSAPARHRRREAPEAGRRPEPRHPGQYRTRPRCSPMTWSTL